MCGNMDVALEIILLLINLLNTFLHITGFYLLFCLYKEGNQEVQIIFLINLSLIEGFMNITGFISQITFFYIETSTIANEIYTYIWIIDDTGINFIYFMTITFITIDKWLEILLNIKYFLYVNERKVKYLLTATWLIGLLFSIGLSVAVGAFKIDYENIEEKLVKFYYPTFDFIFIIVLIVCYAYIFRQFKQTRVMPHQQQTSTTVAVRQSTFLVFRKSKFFIPFLLTLTYVLFVLIPDLLYLFIAVVNDNFSVELDTACYISYAVSDLVDAILYIFLYDDVRRLLWRKIKTIREKLKCYS